MAPAKTADLGTVSGSSSSTTRVLTLTAAASAGATVLLAVVNNSSTGISGVADSRSNTWTERVSTSNTTAFTIHLVESVLTTGLQIGDTITITFAGGVNSAASATAWSGLGAYMGVSTRNDYTTTSAVAGSYTTTSSGALIIGLFGANGTFTIGAPGSGYTALPDVSSATTTIRSLQWEYKIGSAAGAEQATATLSGTGFSAGSGVTLAYAAAVDGGGGGDSGGQINRLLMGVG